MQTFCGSLVKIELALVYPATISQSHPLSSSKVIEPESSLFPIPVSVSRILQLFHMHPEFLAPFLLMLVLRYLNHFNCLFFFTLLRIHSFLYQLQEPLLEVFTYGPPSSYPAQPRDPLAGWLLFPPFLGFLNTLGLTLKFERSQVVLEVLQSIYALSFQLAFFLAHIQFLCFCRLQTESLPFNLCHLILASTAASTLWPLYSMQVVHL